MKKLVIGSYVDNQRDAYSKKRRVQPKGQHSPNAKLTNAQAEDIRQEYLAGATQNSLAKKYGVSQVAISLIIRGRTYNG
jgi:predicted DNA-binding protein (UPF0251 family)